MNALEGFERELAAFAGLEPREAAPRLLGLAEGVLEAWITARGEEPAAQEREGFRLLALHHQGARGVPSFNACRETCREVAYHYNVLTAADAAADPERQAQMMTMLVRHLALFVAGKLEHERLGEFCCASKPLRAESSTMHGE